jgi:hypothetical protein
MAEAKGKKETAGVEAPAEAAAGPRRVELGIRLVPVNNSDQPVVSNYAALNVAPGMAFIDFGFLEPNVMAALPQVVNRGGKLPDQITGKLAVRVAVGFEALANLHQQLGRVLAGLNQAQQRAAAARKDG